MIPKMGLTRDCQDAIIGILEGMPSQSAKIALTKYAAEIHISKLSAAYNEAILADCYENRIN